MFAPVTAVYVIDLLTEKIKPFAPLAANATWKKIATAMYLFSRALNLGRIYSPVFGTLYSHVNKTVLNSIFAAYYVAFIIFAGSNGIAYRNY